MEVDFRAGKGVVFPKDGGQGFDLVRIPEAIQKAGFSAPVVDVVARGKVERSKDRLVLRVPGRPQVFVLEGGKRFAAFQKTAPEGKQVRITGRLHGSHGDSPPGLTVEEFE